MTTLHPKAPASRTAHARQPLRRLLTTAFQPLSAQRARTRISMSDPNWRLRVGRRILASGLALGSSLPPFIDAMLDLRPSTGETLGDSVASLVGGSRSNVDESDDMRERDGIPGEDCWGVKPVTQSMTKTREGWLWDEEVDGNDDEEWASVWPSSFNCLLELGLLCERSSSSVDRGWPRRLTR